MVVELRLPPSVTKRAPKYLHGMLVCEIQLRRSHALPTRHTRLPLIFNTGRPLPPPGSIPFRLPFFALRRLRLLVSPFGGGLRRTVSSLVHAAMWARSRGDKVAWVGGAQAYNLEVPA